MAGTCALMAVLDAMGLLMDDQTFTHEGLIGTSLQARVLSRQTAGLSEGGTSFVVPVVEGSAWITGRDEFEMDDRDALEAFEI